MKVMWVMNSLEMAMVDLVTSAGSLALYSNGELLQGTVVHAAAG